MGGRRRSSVLIACLVWLTTGPWAAPAAAADRLALVIGNAAYENAGPLAEPVRDAEAVAAALGRLGFEVDLQTDLDQRRLQDALHAFGYAAPNAEVALVFFSGHGIQVDGVSYLLPVDAVLRRERDLIYEALPLQLVLDEAAQARGLGLVIVDASRQNPLAERLRESLGPIAARGVEDGLGQIEDVPRETMIALSARPGTTSLETGGANSPYVTALLRHLEEPGLELDLLFRKVRDSVLAATQGRQEPRTYDSLGAEPFYFQEQPNRPPEIAGIAPLEVLDDAGPVPLDLPVPSDPDGHRLMIEVTGVPERGAVLEGERPLAPGDLLGVEDLAALRYRPEPGEVGDVGGFDVMIEDEQGAATGAMLPIVVKSSNRPPVVAERQVLQVSAVPLNLQTPIDLDGDAMTVEVVELPNKGIVRDGGRIVRVGDRLSLVALAGLMLVTEEGGAFGTFAFDVVDERGARTRSRLDIALSTSFERTATPVAGAAPTGADEEGAPAAAVQARPTPATAAVSTSSEPAKEPVAAAPAAAEPARAEPVRAEPAPEAPAVPAVTTAAVPDGAAADEPEAAMYRTTRLSNIRAEPRVEAERVATVPADTLLKVTGQADGQNWYAVETEDGQTGYIYFALVQPATMTDIKAKLPQVRSSGEVLVGPRDR